MHCERSDDSTPKTDRAQRLRAFNTVKTVKYAAANMQILTTRGQILKVEVSGYLASYLAVLG